jgi:hypothetical protein
MLASCLCLLTHLEIQSPKATVAVSLERARFQLVGEAEGLAVGLLSRLDCRRIEIRMDFAEKLCGHDVRAWEWRGPQSPRRSWPTVPSGAVSFGKSTTSIPGPWVSGMANRTYSGSQKMC